MMMMMMMIIIIFLPSVPDFRSGMGTVLKTGPGVWELKAKKKSRSPSRHPTVATTKAIPTPSHMMMVKLCQVNVRVG